MQSIWESPHYRETYDANTTPFVSGTPCLRLHTFCHSISYRNWKNGTAFKRPDIIAFLILSGEQQLIRPHGGKELISAGYFSMIDLNNIDIDFVTLSEKAERYFVLFENNNTLNTMIKNMFPAGLPSFTCIEPEKIKKCFENIRAEIIAENADDARIGGAAYALLHEVMTQFPAEQLPRPLTLALEYINSNFQKVQLSREDIARAACVSISTLGALFRKHLKRTIWQTLCDKRMEKVKQLLTFSNKPIADIAEECGFSYSYYLTREFRSLYDMTPSAYRRNSRSDKKL